jgi:predicted nucleotidyltransferase
MSFDGAIPRERLADFCRRWGVRNMWLFGSTVRGDATPQSDVDVLVDFHEDARASTWDWPAMTDELAAIFGQKVDLLSMGVLRNPYRRASIMAHRELVYAA